MQKPQSCEFCMKVLWKAPGVCENTLPQKFEHEIVKV